MRILSVQSWVVHGHVGNAAALFALQRLGAETLGLNTVQFSNHTGYGDWTGSVTSPDGIAALGEGIARRGALDGLDAVLSGYVGAEAAGEAILGLVDAARARSPGAIWACDPVMGDVGRGLFVAPGIADFFRERALARATLLTPNRFELLLLAGEPEDASDAAVARAASGLLARMRPGPSRAVLVTSLAPAAAGGDPQQRSGAIDLLLVTDRGRHRIRTERIPIEVDGAGDLIAALFLFHVLDGGDPVAAAERAACATWRVIEATRALGRRELALVAAQDELCGPPRGRGIDRFRAVPDP